MTHPLKISFNSIACSFSGTKLLDNIDISLAPGKITLLSGENGTGKTTLLKILSGLLKPNSGFVDFGNGLSNWKRNRKQLIQTLMYMHQMPYMFAGSVYRNLSIAVPDNIIGTAENDLINKALEWGMLSKYKQADAKTLSGGQQQRVALSRAWLRHPRYLLLDEPVANMDSQSAIRTVKLLHLLKEFGVGMVICSHNNQIFKDLIDIKLDLVNGKLSETGTFQYSGNVTSLETGRPLTNMTIQNERPSR